MRLTEIAPEKLAEIRNYCILQKNKIPVLNDTDECLVRIIPKKYGIHLSAPQIYRLQKGMKTYRVSLPVSVVEELEDQYGSVAKGIKMLSKFAGKPELPSSLERPYRALLKKRRVAVADVEAALDPFIEKGGDPWKIIGDLSKRGLLSRDEDEFVIHSVRRDPLVELFMTS